MKLGVVVLPEYPWPDATRVWREVEQLGVDHAWTFDHLSWRAVGDGPWFDAMTTLAAAATVTDRMVLGTLVATPNLHHPAILASQAMTVDHLSGGRFCLGLGAGAAGPDSAAMGAAPLTRGERTERFEEFVAATDLLLKQRETTTSGKHFSVQAVPMRPGCVQRPRVPFAVAAAGPRGMRLAVEYAEIWVTIGDPKLPGGQGPDAALATLRSQLDRLALVCEEAGRDPATLRKLVNLSRIVDEPYRSVERFADLVGRCGEIGFTDVVVNYPRPLGTFAGDPDDFARAMSNITLGGP